MTKPSRRVSVAKDAAPVDKSRQIEIGRKEGETDDQAVAAMMVRGTVGNASTVIEYSRVTYPGLSLTDMARSLKEHGEAVNRNDLSALERMLTGQAVALNAMFTELARRGALNMGEHLGATESYVRLALKAQSQCRSTIETLAVIKNPPVFARQANIAHGPQQVNNGTSPHASPECAQAGAGARETGIEQNKLLEQHDGEWLDTGAPSAASGVDTAVAAVGAVDRAGDGRG